LTRLVVTADDVGLAPGMTAGSLQAAERGIVTAVSVAPVGEAFEEAIAGLRRRPQLDVGAHLVLVGERPLSPPADVPSLLGHDGRLLPGFGAFCARWVRGGVDLVEVELELRRQLARLVATGLRVVHVNSHQHLHALPRLFTLVARLAAEHGIPFVRVPADVALPPPVTPRAAALRGLALLARRDRHALPVGVRALDGTLGLHRAGRLDAATLRALVSRAAHAGGTLELVCHPGLGDRALRQRYDWGYRWDDERATLCLPIARGLLSGAGVELTAFSDLLA